MSCRIAATNAGSDSKPAARATWTASRFATMLAGAEGGLRDTYGLSAAELARLLNKVRAEQTGRF